MIAVEHEEFNCLTPDVLSGLLCEVKLVVDVKGKLDKVKYRKDKLFGYEVPITCPDVPEDVLSPENSWGSKDEYWKKYDALAARFQDNFKLFEKGCSQEVINAGPKRLAQIK